MFQDIENLNLLAEKKTMKYDERKKAPSKESIESKTGSLKKILCNPIYQCIAYGSFQNKDPGKSCTTLPFLKK